MTDRNTAPSNDTATASNAPLASSVVTPLVAADLGAEVRRRELDARKAQPDYDGSRRIIAIFPGALAMVMGAFCVVMFWKIFGGTKPLWPSLKVIGVFGALGVASAALSRAWWKGKNPFWGNRLPAAAKPRAALKSTREDR